VSSSSSFSIDPIVLNESQLSIFCVKDDILAQLSKVPEVAAEARLVTRLFPCYFWAFLLLIIATLADVYFHRRYINRLILLPVIWVLLIIPIALDLHFTLRTLKGGVKNLGAAMFSSCVVMIPLSVFFLIAWNEARRSKRPNSTWMVLRDLEPTRQGDDPEHLDGKDGDGNDGDGKDGDGNDGDGKDKEHLDGRDKKMRRKRWFWHGNGIQNDIQNDMKRRKRCVGKNQPLDGKDGIPLDGKDGKPLDSKDGKPSKRHEEPLDGRD
jgi:hypothetical protein